MNAETLSKVPKTLPKRKIKAFDYETQINLADFIIKAFPLRHTSQVFNAQTGYKEEVPCECSGFLIFEKETREKMLWITDTAFIQNQFPPVDYICVECNYFEKDSYVDDLQFVKNIDVEKRRVKSHLSFEECVKFVNHQDLSKCKEIRLLHLSSSLTEEQRQSIARKFKQEIRVKTIKIIV